MDDLPSNWTYYHLGNNSESALLICVYFNCKSVQNIQKQLKKLSTMFEHCRGVLWLARLLTAMMNWESWWEGTHQVTITIYKRKQQYFKTDIEKGYYY